MTTLAEIQAKSALKEAKTEQEKRKYASMIATMKAIELVDRMRLFPMSEKDITTLAKLVNPINIHCSEEIIKEVENEVEPQA